MVFRLKNIVFASLILIIAGCAAPPQKKQEVVFFPPAPELPRIQYLTSYTYVKDIEEQSAFKAFVEGEKENKRIDKPYGVGIYDGKIYVCDTNNAVFVIDLKRKTLERFKGSKGPGKLIQPLNISIEADGTKYITDPIRGQVVAFDRNDEYLKAYGTPGKWKPVDAAAFEDRLYIADNMNGVIRVYDKKSGQVIRTIGDKGEPSERLDRPTNLAFDRDGNLYVTDASRFQVVKFDRDGHLLSTFGKLGDGIGQFARPKGISVDREGNLYTVDAAFGNVQIFNKNQRFLLFFGESGVGPGNFLLPAKVAIDYDNLEYFQKYVEPNFEINHLIFVTSQAGERVVNVLGYGKEKGKKYPTEEELLKVIEEKRKQEIQKFEKAKKSLEGDEEEKKSGKSGEGADAAKPDSVPLGK